jgi:hypothetical protein
MICNFTAGSAEAAAASSTDQVHDVKIWSMNTPDQYAADIQMPSCQPAAAAQAIPFKKRL